jgi:hypothetical protein
MKLIFRGGESLQLSSQYELSLSVVFQDPKRLILCFERGLRPLNMKISISTVLLRSDRLSIIHSQEMLISAANVRQH